MIYSSRILIMPHARNTAVNQNAAGPVKLTVKSDGPKSQRTETIFADLQTFRGYKSGERSTRATGVENPGKRSLRYKRP